MNLPIIDTHLHLWDPAFLRYPWLKDIPLLNKTYMLKEYLEQTSAFNIERMVFLQCDCDASQFLDEAKWIAELATTQEPRIQGIVPFAPLEKGVAAAAELDALKKIRLVKGIRRLIQSEAVDFCISPEFVKGVKLLAKYGYHFEICIRHEQLENAVKLAQQCPEVNFILDHLGKPAIKDDLLDPWRKNLKALAALPNTWCKMSGVVTEADNANWTPGSIKPYIDHVMESFGVDRVIFGGDWPVVLMASSYERWVTTLWSALSGIPEADQRKIFHDNAMKFYRL